MDVDVSGFVQLHLGLYPGRSSCPRDVQRVQQDSIQDDRIRRLSSKSFMELAPGGVLAA